MWGEVVNVSCLGKSSDGTDRAQSRPPLIQSLTWSQTLQQPSEPQLRLLKTQTSELENKDTIKLSLNQHHSKLQMVIKWEIKSYLFCSWICCKVQWNESCAMSCKTDIHASALSRTALLALRGSSKRGSERERKETRDEINLGTDLFPGRSQVSIHGFFTKLNPKTVEWIKCMVDHFILLKIKIFTFKMIRTWLLTFGSKNTFTWLDWKLSSHLKSESFLSFSARFWDCFKFDCLLYLFYLEWSL